MEEEDSLFEDVMQGRWERVVIAYENLETQKLKITTSEDTVLHIAISNGQTDTVRQLVEQIEERDAASVLGLQNVIGSTAIHLAAAFGDASMCECISTKAPPHLIGSSNHDGETPIFLAAAFGKKDSFFCLLDKLDSEQADEVCRRRSRNGDTILHAAISGEHFELAYHIIQEYPELVNTRREDGASPLHILASKPNAFRSSSHFGLFDRIIYCCAIVDDLKQTQCLPSLQDSDRSSKCPENYATCITFFHLMQKIAGHTRVSKIQRIKVAHTWAVLVLNALVDRASLYKYQDSGRKPPISDIVGIDDQTSQTSLINKFVPDLGETERKEEAILVAAKMGITNIVDKFIKACPAAIQELNTETKNLVLVSYEKENASQFESVNKETPILIAAKMGVKEMVQKILETFPVAIHDLDSNNKNVVLLAVENKHVQVFKFLKENVILKESVFGRVDKDGNSALHLAATFGDSRPWLIPGAGLQMQWELKWYKFVKQSMPPNFFPRYNKKGYTPKQILAETHKQLAKNGSEWLTKTSESCSVVAALIATVAFAGSATVPGGTKEATGEPVLVEEPAFNVFAITSLVALCLSVTSLVTFLTVLTSRFEHRDFAKTLPRTLIWGLTSLFLSITTMLVSFCAAHFYTLEDSLRMFSYPVYAATCLPVTIFLLSTFSLYYDLIWAIYSKEPQHSFKEFHP
ncbi:Ankyrin repeat-containing protein ITN1 [Linum grandiflorum]